jgi:hypothetical protein
MSLFTTYRQDKTLPSVTDGNAGNPRIDSMATLVTAEYVQALIMGGHAYAVNRGTATTPISFAKTAYDEDQPQLVVRVPSGTVIVPIALEVSLEDSAGTDNGIVWGVSENDVGAGTSTAITGRNMRSDAPNSTGCTIQRDYTGNATAVSNMVEHIRDGYAFADATTDPIKTFRYSVKDTPMPMLVGAASLILWVWGASTAPSGFATVKWVELTSSQAGV